MQLAPGIVIAGRFRLNRPLGKGAMGSVWHATHLGLDVPCAVKFMEGAFTQTPELVARFESEAKSAAKLHSPNVVQILDHGVSDGVPYIAMELLEGEDLGKRLERVGRLPPIDAVRIIRDVCRALTRAHAEGVVHRDLKPENIYLVKDMDRELAKVLDFGIAKVETKDSAATTRAGQVLGTPYYMSPEQVRGAALVDARSDLWSLGIIVFRCLTGRLPFDAQSLAELMVKIMGGPIPVASEVAPDLPRRFDLWWARAAQRDPAKRFQSAKDMDVALALAFGFSPVAGKKAGRTLEMPMTDEGSEMHLPARPPQVSSSRPPAGTGTVAGAGPATAPSGPPAPAVTSNRPAPPLAAPGRLPIVPIAVAGAVLLLLGGAALAVVAAIAARSHSVSPGPSSTASAALADPTPPTASTAPPGASPEVPEVPTPSASASHAAPRPPPRPRPVSSRDLGF